MKRKIYLLNTARGFTKMTAISLLSARYNVKAFFDAKELINTCNDDAPKMIIVDLDDDRFDVLNFIEQVQSNRKIQRVPLVILSEDKRESSVVRALDKGADDYIIKPLSHIELVSRINAIFRRCIPKNDMLSYQGISLDLKERVVIVNDEIIDLTFKEYELLKLFMLNANRAISREIIYNKVWEGEIIHGTRTVDMHIKNLRHKICMKDANPTITTLPKVGYRFDVKEVKT